MTVEKDVPPPVLNEPFLSVESVDKSALNLSIGIVYGHATLAHRVYVGGRASNY